MMVGLGSRQPAAPRGEGRRLLWNERLTPGDLGLVLGPEPAEREQPGGPIWSQQRGGGGEGGPLKFKHIWKC